LARGRRRSRSISHLVSGEWEKGEGDVKSGCASDVVPSVWQSVVWETDILLSVPLVVCRK
jgi:hypothetical protein